MKYLLIGINSKYSHTNLAIRILRAYAKSPEVSLCEYTINENRADVLSDIYKKGAKALFFSCYIWNIEYIKKLCMELRKITYAKIILGGPEVSFNTEQIMRECPAVDAVIIGEGEETFSELIQNGLDFENTDGVMWRSESLVKNKSRELIDINKVVFPYTKEEIKKLKDRLIYYETARGCPFNCSYCMSSTIKGVRYKSLDIVKEELKFFIDNDVKIVKLTDRTFNANPKRAYKILKFLIENAKNTTFHFEIAAHILDDELFSLLEKAPKNLFQFEIGVQSTNPSTISAINRKTDFLKISKEVKRIKALKNIHIHLDLIAGLPYETLDIFKKSFNDVFLLKPDMLQLGFLKLLHGTKIRAEEESHGYLYSDFPPYEILENSYISYKELTELKRVEDIVDKFYNSGVFLNTVEFLLKKYETPYDMFYDLSRYFDENGLFSMSHSRNGLYEILVRFSQEKGFGDVFLDILKLDLFLSGANRSPEWSPEKHDEVFYKKRFEFIENNPEIFCEFTIPPKEIIKQVQFEKFSYDVLGDLKKKDTVIVFFKDGRVKELNKI